MEVRCSALLCVEVVYGLKAVEDEGRWRFTFSRELLEHVCLAAG